MFWNASPAAIDPDEQIHEMRIVGIIDGLEPAPRFHQMLSLRALIKKIPQLPGHLFSHVGSSQYCLSHIINRQNRLKVAQILSKTAYFSPQIVEILLEAPNNVEN
jgi:hypothetical protein